MGIGGEWCVSRGEDVLREGLQPGFEYRRIVKGGGEWSSVHTPDKGYLNTQMVTLKWPTDVRYSRQ